MAPSTTSPPLELASPLHPIRPSRPRNGWIVLDPSWADRLGVQRQGGTYRIRRRDLVERLAMLRSRPGDPTAAMQGCALRVVSRTDDPRFQPFPEPAYGRPA